jgi:hypothetical protein
MLSADTKLRNFPDLGEAMQTLISNTFIRYNGCLIEKHGSTYVWNRKCYPSLDAAKQAIGSVNNIIANSLNRA